MAMDVRIPERDRPPVWSLALVGALALGTGLGLAAWARGVDIDAGRRSSSETVEHGVEPGAAHVEPVEELREPDAPPEEARAESAADGAAAEPEPSEAPPDSTLDPEPSEAPPDSTLDPEPAAAALTDSDDSPRVDSDDSPRVDSDDSPRVDSDDLPRVDPAIGSGDESATGPAPEGLGVRRGRVAYLRCDGVPPQRGPFPCPRDEPMEATVWPAIDGLVRCAAGPRRAGEGDLRVEFSGSGAPDVAWRDTFARDVVRLEPDEVLECVRAPLAAARQSIGARRLTVSFRFAVLGP